MSEQIWFKIEMFLYMYIVIYIFFEYTKMYIYIFLFTDIIYNTPAQKVYFTQIPLHSWCLEKKTGCSSRAFAWLCAVTWTEVQKIWPHGWSDPVVNKKWFINMKFCSPTCPKLFKWICLNVVFFDRRLVERWELDFPNLEWIDGNCFDS